MIKKIKLKRNEIEKSHDIKKSFKSNILNLCFNFSNFFYPTVGINLTINLTVINVNKNVK